MTNVIYVNSLGVKAPAVTDGGMSLHRIARKARSMARYFRDSGEGFGVMTPIYYPGLTGLSGRGMSAALAAQIRFALRIRKMKHPLIWVACPAAARVLSRLAAAGTVYQLSDLYSGLLGGECGAVAEMEETIARLADLVVCSSAALLERSRRLYGYGEYVDHGVDWEMFSAAGSDGMIPEVLGHVRRPIIGFFGNIDGNTVDRVLLDRVIASRRDYTFVLLGAMAPEFMDLRRHSNVVAVPQQPYRDVARFGGAFDVCIMPWLQNQWIEHCNPVKLKEYLTLGKPVVSTPFRELSVCGAPCYVARGPEAFADAVDRALSEDNELRRRERREWARGHSWEAKFATVLRLLRERGILPA
ncbi:MAG: glycosyltransferase [Planctomycetota bacterium]